MTDDEHTYQRRLAHGTAWTIGGLGVRSAIRLFSNVVFTRLFLPEIFGLVAIYKVIQQGLVMCTEFGATSNIIRHRQGGEDHFLHTAWTVQVFRSILVMILGCALAYPVALFYRDPRLAPLMIAKSLQAICIGLYSINLIAMQRQVLLGRITIIGIGWSVISFLGTLLWGYYSATAWAFVFGSVAGTIFYLIMSYIYIPGPGMRFWWDRGALYEIYHYGKWIFLGSVSTFLCLEGDRLIMGALISLSHLGVYFIAYQLIFTVLTIQQSLSTDILLPAYTRYKDHHHRSLRRKIHHLRRKLFIYLFPAPILGAIFAQPIVNVLYAPIFSEAGWMLRIMAIGLLAQMTTGTLAPIFLAVGDARHYMMYQASRAALIIAGTVIGYLLNDLHGIIVGIALSHYLAYPILIVLMRKHHIYNPLLDLTYVGSSLAAIALGIWLF